MYYWLLGGLAILGCVCAAGGVIVLAFHLLNAGQRARLAQRREVAILRGKAKSAEIDVEMGLHQLELRRDALMNPELDGKQLPPGMPVDLLEEIEKGEILDAKEKSAKYYCPKCGATYVRQPPYTGHDYVSKCNQQVNGKRCNTEVKWIEKAKVTAEHEDDEDDL